jgi:hypothetical protein
VTEPKIRRPDRGVVADAVTENLLSALIILQAFGYSPEKAVDTCRTVLLHIEADNFGNEWRLDPVLAPLQAAKWFNTRHLREPGAE